MKIIKNQVKKLKVYKKIVFQIDLPSPPLKVYGLYTYENVDIYGRPLTMILMSDQRHLFANQFTTYLQPVINWSELYC